METTSVQVRAHAPGTNGYRSAPAHGPLISRDAQFVGLLNAYRPSGGLARAGDVWASIQRHGVSMNTLARWMAGRELLHFEWQGESWLPLFQFNGSAAQPRAAVGQVLAELADAMPAWRLAQWFVQPNSALAGCCPADVLAADAPAVVQAARADRRLIDA